MCRLPLTVASALVASAVLAGCGGSSASSGAGTGPVTPTSLAAVVADHAGTPRSSKAYDDNEFADGESTLVRYPEGASIDLSVGTKPRHGVPECSHRPPYADGCADVDGAVLLWADEEPEEDPGIIHVYRVKDDVTVLLTYSGPLIHGDPRKQDLPIDVSTLLKIVNDPRVH